MSVSGRPHQWQVPIHAQYCGRCGVLKNQPEAKLPCEPRSAASREKLL